MCKKKFAGFSVLDAKRDIDGIEIFAVVHHSKELFIEEHLTNLLMDKDLT